jgi:hypothetical protein
MMKQGILWRAAILIAALMLAQPALAQGAAAVRKQVEASLRVTGSITIATDGSVERVELDAPEALPKGIAAFVGGNVAAWRFEPVLVDGKPRRALTKMSALVVGKSIGDDQMQVSIRGADFGDYAATPEAERVVALKLKPPSYPAGPARSGAQGTAYLLVKVERDGSVGEVATEQVNLRIVTNEAQMNQYRERFATAAMAAARTWTFTPPTAGEEATQPYWVVRVPVDFTFGGQQRQGKWEVYVPGPRSRPIWAPDEDQPGFAPGALAEGGVHLAGNKSGPRLLTPLDGA